LDRKVLLEVVFGILEKDSLVSGEIYIPGNKKVDRGQPQKISGIVEKEGVE
jgi:hypothetical protein